MVLMCLDLRGEVKVRVKRKCQLVRNKKKDFRSGV
jgi:hypothetical protein